jgi:hypothetical protein
MTDPASRSGLPFVVGALVWILSVAALVLASLVLVGACPHPGDPSVTVARVVLLGSPIGALVPAFLAARLVERLRQRR